VVFCSRVHVRVGVRVRARACLCVSVRVCVSVRMRVRASVHACVHVCVRLGLSWSWVWLRSLSVAASVSVCRYVSGRGISRRNARCTALQRAATRCNVPPRVATQRKTRCNRYEALVPGYLRLCPRSETGMDRNAAQLIATGIRACSCAASRACCVARVE
jgi:hypothetical protein